MSAGKCRVARVEREVDQRVEAHRLPMLDAERPAQRLRRAQVLDVALAEAPERLLLRWVADSRVEQFLGSPVECCRVIGELTPGGEGGGDQ